MFLESAGPGANDGHAAVVLTLLAWRCGVAPMMGGLYLRRPEEAQAAPIA